MKENMGASHEVILVGNPSGRETMAQPKTLQPCIHTKKYTSESEGSIKDFLERGFTKLHVTPFSSIEPWKNERDEWHKGKFLLKVKLYFGHIQHQREKEILQEVIQSSH